MALRAYDIRMVIYGQNMAGNMLRNMSRDLRSISTQTAAMNRTTGARLGIQRDLLALQKSEARTLGINVQLEKNRLRQMELKSSMQTGALGKLKVEKMEQVRLNALLGIEVDQRKIINTELGLSNAQLKEAQALQARVSAERLGAVGRGLGHVGRTAQFAGIIGAAALGGTAVAAAHFNTQSTLAATQMIGSGKTANQVLEKQQVLQKQILIQMRQFPATSAEMARSAYDIFSSIPDAVNNTKLGFKLMQDANKVAVGGMTTLDTATTAVVRAYNNFVNKNTSVNSVLNTMFAIVRFGNMHFDQFTQMLSQVGPAARSAGQSLKDVGGAMALLSLHLPTQQAATGLFRLLQIIQRPAFLSGAKNLGVNIVNASGRQILPIIQIYENFLAKYPFLAHPGILASNFIQFVTSHADKGVHQRSTMGTAQAQKASAFLLTSLQEWEKLQKQITSDNGEFTRSYAAMAQSSGVKWSVFMNIMKATVIQIGETVIPVFARIGDKIRSILDWWNRLSPGVRKAVGHFAAWAAIGLVLGGVFASVVGGIIGLFASVRILTMGLGTTEGGGLLFGLTRLASILSFLGGIGTIKIGIDLEKKGGAWGLLGHVASTIGGYITGSVAAKGLARIGGDVATAGSRFAGGFGAAWALAQRGEAGKSYIDPKTGEYVAKIGGNTIHTGITAKSFRPTIPTTVGPAGPFGVGPGQAGLFQQFPGGKATDTTKHSLTWYMTHEPQKFIDKVSKSILAHQKISAQEKQFIQQLNQATTAAAKGIGDATRLADAAVNAQYDTANKLTQITQKLRDTYEQFQTANQSMFGDLFGGRIMQGPLGQVYSTLAQYNISPPFTALMQDLQSQNKDFAQYQKDVKKLRGEGVSNVFIQELQATGPQGRLAVHSLANASKSQIDAYVKELKKKHGAIDSATKTDFSAQLKDWKSYGAKTLFAMLAGMRSVSTKIGADFKKYVLSDVFDKELRAWATKTFGKQLADYIFSQTVGKTAAKIAAKHGAKSPATRSPQMVTGNGSTYVYNQNLYAAPGERIPSMLRRARHEYEIGHRLGGGL